MVSLDSRENNKSSRVQLSRVWYLVNTNEVMDDKNIVCDWGSGLVVLGFGSGCMIQTDSMHDIFAVHNCVMGLTLMMCPLYIYIERIGKHLPFLDGNFMFWC